ncbi:hypothetical protein AOX55_00005839 (plasmid) [Sinorhizobium fredii CCBAU 25509]|nr:hypothetical protein AOX55_00005839 [Sinorhizobium fredii CCBAU 25509]
MQERATCTGGFELADYTDGCPSYTAAIIQRFDLLAQMTG